MSQVEQATSAIQEEFSDAPTKPVESGIELGRRLAHEKPDDPLHAVGIDAADESPLAKCVKAASDRLKQDLADAGNNPFLSAAAWLRFGVTYFICRHENQG
jgi:hypothetical protein